MNPDRQLFGLLGAFPDTSEKKRYWNSYFTQNRIDAFLDHYPTSETEIPERLSEMFHFDRRGYIVGKSLQKAIILQLDRLDSSAAGEGRASLILNDGGVLIGFVCESPEEAKAVWNV